MKAAVGDYLKPDLKKIVIVDEESYVLEDGSIVSDSEISYDDVLLESEVVK